MKRLIITLTVCSLILTGCVKELLDQLPKDVISKDMFWKKTAETESLKFSLYKSPMRSPFTTFIVGDSGFDAKVV